MEFNSDMKNLTYRCTAPEGTMRPSVGRLDDLLKNTRLTDSVNPRPDCANERVCLSQRANSLLEVYIRHRDHFKSSGHGDEAHMPPFRSSILRHKIKEHHGTSGFLGIIEPIPKCCGFDTITCSPAWQF